MGMEIKEFIAQMSTVKIIVLIFTALIFTDMLFYYLASIIGRNPSPYPIIYEMFSLLKEIRIDPVIH